MNDLCFDGVNGYKCYPTIDHEVLLGKIARKVKDRRVLELCARVIHDGPECEPVRYRPFPGDDLFSPSRRRGIPIGNLTSQHFAK